MTDEEMAEEYEATKHYRYEDNDYCGDIADGVKQAYLAGLKAGSPKWHKVADGDLPPTSGEMHAEHYRKTLRLPLLKTK